MKRTLPVLIALLALTAGGGYAQNETKSFSASIKGRGNYTKLPSGEWTAQHNSTLSYKHTFAITPEQEQLMNENPSITFDFDEYSDVSFNLSDDPKWQPGNTSAKISNTIEDSWGVYKTTAKVKWGNGQFSISAKVTQVGNGLVDAKKSTRVPGHPNATTYFETEIEGSTWEFQGNHFVSYDSKSQSSETIKADGTETESESYSMKSKSLVDEPL